MTVTVLPIPQSTAGARRICISLASEKLQCYGSAAATCWVRLPAVGPVQESSDRHWSRKPRRLRQRIRPPAHACANAPEARRLSQSSMYPAHTACLLSAHLPPQGSNDKLIQTLPSSRLCRCGSAGTLGIHMALHRPLSCFGYAPSLVGSERVVRYQAVRAPWASMMG